MSDLAKLSDDELIALLNKSAPAPSSVTTPKKEPIGFIESIPLGFKKAGLGLGQAALDAAEFGLNAAEGIDPFFGKEVYEPRKKAVADLKKDAFDVERQYREKGEGSGPAGAAGEFLGGMMSPVSIATMATAPASGALGLALQGAKIGAATGLTSPLEEGQSRLAAGAIGAGAGAVLTPLTAKATALLAKKANQSFNALRGQSPVAKTADELKALAEPLYAIKNAASQTALKPSAYGKAALELEKIANPKGFAREQLRESGGDAVYNFYQKSLLPFAKREITLDDFDVIDDQFQKAIEDVAPNSLLGKSGDKPAQARLTKMRQLFHDTIQGAPDSAFIGGKGGAIAWRQADKIKAAEFAIRDLDTLIQKSMDKDQPAKAIQTGLAQILNSPRYSKAFNDKEKELMRSAIKTGVIGEGLRTLSSRLGALGALLTGGIETAAAVTAGGALTREAAEAARVKGIDTVKQAITSRAIGTPMPVMPDVGVKAGAQVGKAATIGATQGITGARGVSPEDASTGLESLSDDDLINLLNEGGEPTRINIAPAVNGQDLLQGTQGMPSVTLPEVIPDTSNFTQQNEGLRLSTYMDTTGNPTIGYGNNLNSPVTKQAWKAAGIQTPFNDAANGKAAITPQEALNLHEASQQIAFNDAADLFPTLAKMPEGRKMALIDMSYQLGKPRLAKFGNMIAAINSGDYVAAVKHLMKSDLAKQTPERARRVARMILTGRVQNA